MTSQSEWHGPVRIFPDSSAQRAAFQRNLAGDQPENARGFASGAIWIAGPRWRATAFGT